MKNTNFLLTAVIAVLILSVTSINAQNFRADYQLPNLQSITEVAIAVDGNNGFMAVVSGKYYTGYDIIMLVKLNYKFEIVWTKSIYYYPLTTYNFCANDIKRDPNGGYAICGKYYDPNMPSYRGGFLMSIDDNGDMLWTIDAREIYNTDRCEELKSVEIVGNQYISCGYSIDNGQPKEGFVWSVDKNTQNVEWTKTENTIYPNQVDVELNDIVYNPADQLLYTCGSFCDVNGTPKAFVLASYDLNGINVISQKYADNALNSMEGKALTINNLDVYVTGNVDFGGSEDVFSACVKTNGNMMWSKRLDISTGDRVEDILFFNNQLYSVGSSVYQGKDGLIMQTDINGNPAFSALYFDVQIPKLEFYKMLYRDTYTYPSIIKIGKYDNSNYFSIVETYIPYQQSCFDEQLPIHQNSMNMNSSIVDVDHTKLDFTQFHVISSPFDLTDRFIVCNSLYFATGPQHEKSTIEQSKTVTQENAEGVFVFNNQISLPLSYQNATYKLYSIDGRLITSGNINTNYCLDISVFNKGIYLLHLQSTNNGIKIIKIIK